MKFKTWRMSPLIISKQISSQYCDNWCNKCGRGEAEIGGCAAISVILEDVSILVKELKEDPVGPPEPSHNVILAAPSTQTDLKLEQDWLNTGFNAMGQYCYP